MNLNIVFAVDNNGFDMTAVAMYSVIKNNPKHKLNFYLFHKNISDHNISRLMRLEQKFSNTQVKSVVIDKDRFKNVKVNNENVTTEAYFRYLAPEILHSEPRALYMDFDMLCLTDLQDLYNTDLDDKYIGAVADYVVEHSPTFRGYKEGIGFSKNEKYVNSGLLLLDLEKLRKSKEMTLFWSNLRNKHKIIPKELNFFADQTVTNLTFKGKIKVLDAKYNVFTTVLEETKQKNPVIIHFTGTYKPLTYRNADTALYDEIYYTYYRECMNIVGDDGDVLIKNILKKLSMDANKAEQKLRGELKLKDNQLQDAEKHISDIEARLVAQDILIKSQDAQLNGVITSQKRTIKLLLEKVKKKMSV
ncbi:Glycosyl transferase family protein [Candidatus Saccharibacteria bacterium RAAC3_TM7_1]|nr:Glycosyl transferase family protein [Candidatus Saccharibacteria bacterium RAAC3_TM7_1]